MLEEVAVMKKNLDKSKGISSIFKKYINSDRGKYVAFFRNIHHLQEMKPCIEKWFSEAGIACNFYEVHSKNPKKDDQYNAFIDDTGLSVCLSIAMMSEGVHGIDGVILLRDTISPNLYYQQIGRAFSVDMGNVPIIFDLVANCESIMDCSLKSDLLDAIEKRDSEKKNDSDIEEDKEDKKEITKKDIEDFFVYDQVIDAINAFRSIEGRLEGNWDLHIEALTQYKVKEGDCDVPKRHVEVVDGVSVKLGQWCTNIRSVKKGQSDYSYSLTDDRIKQLDEMGFIWDALLYDWKNGLKHFDKYVREHNGDVLVPAAYVDEDGFHTGNWVRNKRSKLNVLPEYKVTKLNERGFIWDVYRNRFENNVKAVAEYYEKYRKYPSGNSKDLEVKRLAEFLYDEKKKMRNKNIVYPEWKIEILKYLPDFFWETRTDRLFKEFIYYAKIYKEKHGHLNITKNDIIDGYNIGKNRSNLSKFQLNELERLGIRLGNNNEKRFNNMVNIAKQAVEEGVIIRGANQKYKEKNLYAWIFSTVKRKYKKNKLSIEEKKIIEKLMGKSLNDLYYGNKVKVIDIVENREVGVFRSQNVTARVMREKYNVKISDSIVSNRLTGKTTKPYKGRFMFYYADENEEVTE